MGKVYRMKQFWIDAEVLSRPNICSHIAKKNEFEPGVFCLTVDEYVVGLFSAFGFGIVWALGILFLTGRL